MKFVKYFVPATFDKEGFAKMLDEGMNVRNKIVDDGIILDVDAFNTISAASMPHWAWLNRQDINSPLHTRPAMPEEWPELNPKRRYTVAIIWEDNNASPMEDANGLEYLEGVADDIALNYQDEEGFITVAVIDNNTGEIVYTVEM